MEEILKTASEWEKETGITVLDPDGWDRQNFEQSWAEPITKQEWSKRVCVSTCKFPADFFKN